MQVEKDKTTEKQPQDSGNVMSLQETSQTSRIIDVHNQVWRMLTVGHSGGMELQKEFLNSYISMYIDFSAVGEILAFNFY